jgi:hypothetical protein
MKTNIAHYTVSTAYIAAIALAAFLSDISTAQAVWSYGIGTGITATQIDGQQGFNSLVGPNKYDVNLIPSDLSDMTKSAFGFGGYASDGTWLIWYTP